MKNKAEIPPEICKILNDKVSGSNILLTKLNNYFQKNIRYFGSWHQIIPRLKKEFSNFQAILKYLTILDKQKNIESAGKVLQMYKESERSKYEIIYKELYPLVKNYNDILTISNSKTVLHVLLMLKKDVKNLKVIVSESRPKLEGRTAARFLAKHGIKIEFITEAMLPHYIEMCDCAITGADIILKNGNAVNKTGSRAIAIICKEFNKPFFVVADKSKFSSKTKFVPDKNASHEIWDNKNKMINVNNFYFEEVERKYITKIIS